ncbi:MAG: chloride channel protein [Bacillota bacterium]
MENLESNNVGKHKYLTFITTLFKWVFWGSIIGIAVGSTTAFFKIAVQFLTNKREANPYFLLFLPLGGIIIGYLYKHFGKEADKGNSVVLEYIHHGQGTVPIRMGPLVFLASFITHLFGGSTGREAAAVQMGGSITEAVNRLFRVNKTDQRILFMSGISSGFGSAFSAPLTGTVFGMEAVALGQMKYEALVPCFVSSFVAYFTTKAWGAPVDKHIIYEIPAITADAVLKIIIVSIIFSFTSVLYSKLRHNIENLSKKYLKDPMLIGMVGGIIIIALVYIVGSQDYTGRGLKLVTDAFEGHVPAYAFLAKILFTAVTMGTGFRGGEAIPLFFVGATLGNTLSGIVDLPTSFLAGIGLIAVFCGAANAPISCFLLSIEMFEGKGVIFFFIACIVSYLFSGHNGIYTSQKIYEPKSRMLNITSGERIDFFQQKKKG